MLYMMSFKKGEIMKSFNEWMEQMVEQHPLWWKVYDAMIKLDPEYMKTAPSKEVEKICNDTLNQSGWSPYGDANQQEIFRAAEYCLGMLKSKKI